MKKWEFEDLDEKVKIFQQLFILTARWHVANVGLKYIVEISVSFRKCGYSKKITRVVQKGTRDSWTPMSLCWCGQLAIVQLQFLDVDSGFSSLERCSRSTCGFCAGQRGQLLLVVTVGILWQVPRLQRNDCSNYIWSPGKFWWDLLHKDLACMRKSWYLK